MGLLHNIARLGRRIGAVARIDDPHQSVDRLRICRFETMEERQYLAADVHIGAVYFEDATGDDSQGDTIQVTFEGGEPNTELTHIVIDGDKFGDGPSSGDIFFDTAPGGAGVFGSSPLTIVSHNGFQVLNFKVVDGSSKIEFDLAGFKAGMKLVFSVDTDEIQFVDPVTKEWDVNAIVEGGEFQRSHLYGTFVAAHFENATAHAVFWDAFDDEFATEKQKTGLTLNLPPDSYSSGGVFVDRTAGAVTSIKQIPLPITLAGTVYEDKNISNTQQPGEPGIAGVSVTLQIWNGSSYVATGKTTTTNAQGDYKFDGLLPGKYRVVETQPSGYFSVGATAGHVGNETRGVVTNADVLSEVTLLGGEDSLDNDFAEAKPNSISGYVHIDKDGDCYFTPGDVPLPGVTVQLRDANGTVVATTTTNAGGFYEFNNLKFGTYSVFEVQPAGYYDGDEMVGTVGGELIANDLIGKIVLTSGIHGLHYDFCELPPSSIAGKVWVDNNNNAIFESSEKLLPGVVVQLLDAQNNVIRTATTDANGEYKFDNLAPGTYSVRELQPVGYFDGSDLVGSVGGVNSENDLISQIVLVGDTHGVHYDFAEIPPSSLSGHVHADLDGDCIFDPEEQGIANVKIELLDANGTVLRTTYTDAGGNYKFDGLAPGNYQIRETQPAGYFDSGDHPGSVGGVVLVNDTISQINLNGGVDGINYNFCEIPPAELCGFVYHDANNNGIMDAGEQGIAGVTLILKDASGNPTGATAITDETGEYCFTNLKPGTYSVAEVQPPGWLDGLDTPGNAGGTAINPGDLIVGAVLKPTQHGENYNFGELQPASIRGHVHADLDGDCVFDPEEVGIAGVLMKLYDANGNLVATTTTDAGGNYAFVGLTPGVYTVFETQPAGYFDSGDHVGSAGGVVSANDTISQIDLGSGENGINYNFCEKPPGSISGYVFQDGPVIQVPRGETVDVPAVRDGKLTPDDKRLAGILVELRDGMTGRPILGSASLGGKYPPNSIITAVTDANGYYEFTGLPKGNYAVYEVQDPAGYIDGLNTEGSTGGLVMSAYTTLSPEVLAALTELPASGDAILAISLAPGQSSVMNNFSEVITETPSFYFLNPPPPEPHPYFPMNVFIPPRPPGPEVLTPAPEFKIPMYGSSSMNYTWHLSVIDEGHPRGLEEDPTAVEQVAHNKPHWKAEDLRYGTWTLAGKVNSKVAKSKQVIFGLPDAVPITGDFNGDGVTDVGVFIEGEWYIDVNGNGEWDKHDLWAKLGTRDDKPVTGDWNGDGKTDIGIYGPAWPRDPHAISKEPGIPDPQNPNEGPRKNHPPRPQDAALGERKLKLNTQAKERKDLIDHVFHYGSPDDQPITGDWNGDGIDTIGIFHGGEWYRDRDGDGRWTGADEIAHYGQPGDKAVVGDWNGDGRDELGIFRGGTWYLDLNGNEVIDADDPVIQLGEAGDTPVVGDWNGDGRDEPGVYHKDRVGSTERITRLPAVNNTK